jgi:adenosylmethionine---8-amino-7-oxononanoate aminotransferase
MSHNSESPIWHPFTKQWNKTEEISIVKGEGIYLIDEKGNKYIDAISSWWVNLHGHCNPYISKKVSEQLNQLEHSIFSGFTHPYAIELSQRLLNHLPYNQKKIFFSDNGSTAVEVALKMCLQYFHNRGEEKTTFIAFENAYHGDTFGGMSVGARNVFNNSFDKLLFDVKYIPLPDENTFQKVKSQLKSKIGSYNVAGFIFEPLIQGAAGMLMYEAEHLDELISICRNENVICIADEVMTGFGRTGEFFASDHLNNKPDIICLSKGLTGGYMPLGVTSCAQFIYDAFVDEDPVKTFFHGHSYTGNPTACSAALASIDLMEEENTWNQIKMIQTCHKSFAKKIKSNSKLKDVRFKGTVIAFELRSEEERHYLNRSSQGIADYFLEKGIIIRPLGNVFYVLPPYVISESELTRIYEEISNFFSM